MRLHAHATSVRLSLETLALALIAGSVIFLTRDVEAQPTTVTKKADLVITGATVQSYLIVTQYQTKIYSTAIVSTSYVEIEATIVNKGTEAAVFNPNVRVFDVQVGLNAKADDLATMTIVPPGGTVKKRLTIARPSDLAPGNYAIKLLADPGLVIAETDEANNGYDVSFSVVAGVVAGGAHEPELRQCPAGQFISKNRCVAECPADTFIFSNRACVSVCMSPSFVDGRKCVPSCPTTKFVDNGACLDACPEQRKFVRLMPALGRDKVWVARQGEGPWTGARDKVCVASCASVSADGRTCEK